MDVQMNLDVIGMAFGVSPIAMMLVAPDGRIRTCNAEFDALFGYGPGALTGAPVETLLPEHLRSGHVALRQAFNVIPAKRRMGAEREVKGVARDGTVLPLELALEPVVVDGGPHVIVVALDLRHRHAQRERISSVMDAASCTMVVVDAGGRIDFVNRAVTPLLGYTPEELLGRPVEDLVPEDLRVAHQVYRRSFALLPDVRAKGRSRTVTARHRDGHGVTVEATLDRIDLDGQTGVVATLVDLTERIETERALAARAHELERLNADLEQFSRGVSHDLKAPLASIAGLLSLCREDFAAGETADLGDNLARAAEIAEHSVSEIESVLLATMTTERGIARVPVDLGGLIRQLWRDLSGGAVSARLELELALPETVATEEATLRTVLRNLLSNALRYRDDMKAELVVQVTARQTGEHLRIIVSDNGIGILEAVLPEIFGLFRKHGDRGGSGIGLNLVQRSVERLGGRIVASSTEGQGTTFTLDLPIRMEGEA
ncbi:sensor histidine kinase [Sagittula sp.]|uniref:sensor histidine kinase n=1 Tax=Sagittula sp. TaxID=2038081 RepID=UPI0040590668